ncbi:hypothetical protein PLEOSDRAFT_1100217 [Pleurotus ostreatus PC15]|uniref:Uncharacterized protein n=1 Tax=Pleurotus ostreatus (strain PC15) TaxID=1137138 RepID=A0A067P704_PLEO1|nr:hypothetical protein PLEOSDRAFT_1100217 [Pleurotus ostreatus PC15]
MVFTLFVPPFERELEDREEEELDDRPPELDEELEELEEPPKDEDEPDVFPPELVPPDDELLVLPVTHVNCEIVKVSVQDPTHHPCLFHHHLFVGKAFFVKLPKKTTKDLESTSAGERQEEIGVS